MAHHPVRAALVATFAGAAVLGGCAGRDAEQEVIGGDVRNAPEIGVNSFLWRAALDTIEFMPLSSADPYGGLILSEWYANPEISNEQFKVTVYILDTRLRADAVKVNVARRVYQGPDLGWIDAQTDPGTAVQFENAILTRARQLRIATLSN